MPKQTASTFVSQVLRAGTPPQAAEKPSLASPMALDARYEALDNGALTRGELGRYLVTFVDNHDGVGQNPKMRFGSGAPDDQIIAAIGYLLTAIGTPCLYYGTEQGFSRQRQR